MNSNILIIRLKNGEDIIGNVSRYADHYDISEPMIVDIEYTGKQAGLMMAHWLPKQLIKRNEVSILESDVLFVAEPTDEFSEYYTHTVEKVAKLLKARKDFEDMDEEDLDKIMDAYEELHQTDLILH